MTPPINFHINILPIVNNVCAFLFPSYYVKFPNYIGIDILKRYFVSITL